jgi:hypothetical protein
MPSACRSPRRGLVGGISAIPAISAAPSSPSTSLGARPADQLPRRIGDDWREVFAIPAIPATPSSPSTSLRAGPADQLPHLIGQDWREVSAIPAIPATSSSPSASLGAGPADQLPDLIGQDWREVSAFSASDLAIAARRDLSTAARANAAGLSHDRAGLAGLACDSGAGASRPKATDMVPNLSASVGRHTPQHCSVLSSAMRSSAADRGFWRPGLFVHRYRGSVVPEHGVTATHALPLSASPVARRAVAYAISVVSTGARSAERRDLLSTISGLSWREGLSARPFGPWSRRRRIAICDSPAVTRGEGVSRSAARFQIGALSKIACVTFPLPALPRMAGEEMIRSRS